MAELLAWLRAAVSGAAVSRVDGEPVVRTSSFSVDLVAKRVIRGDAQVHLTPSVRQAQGSGVVQVSGTEAELVADYPDLEPADTPAALQYAAAAVRERRVSLTS
jgi:hypothetical protein